MPITSVYFEQYKNKLVQSRFTDGSGMVVNADNALVVEMAAGVDAEDEFEELLPYVLDEITDNVLTRLDTSSSRLIYLTFTRNEINSLIQMFDSWNKITFTIVVIVRHIEKMIDAMGIDRYSDEHMYLLANADRMKISNEKEYQPQDEEENQLSIGSLSVTQKALYHYYLESAGEIAHLDHSNKLEWAAKYGGISGDNLLNNKHLWVRKDYRINLSTLSEDRWKIKHYKKVIKALRNSPVASARAIEDYNLFKEKFDKQYI